MSRKNENIMVNLCIAFIKQIIDDDELVRIFIRGGFKSKSFDEYMDNIIQHMGWEKYTEMMMEICGRSISV